MNKKFFLKRRATNTVQPPSFATAFGFTTQAFFDHFDSISTIDVNSTVAPGFKWYVNPQHKGPTVSVSNSILTLGSATRSSLWSAVNIANAFGGGNGIFNHGAVGQLFSGLDGFYIEYKAKFNPALTTGNSQINLWSTDYLNWQCNAVPNPLGNSNTVSWAEIDTEENGFGQTLHGFIDPGFNDNITNRSVNYTSPGGPIDFSQFHTWGCLMAPGSKNGGTGLLQFFIDRVQNGADITWAPGSQTGLIELAHQFLIIETETNQTMQIDYVGLWNSGAGWDGPTTNLTHRWPMNDARVSGTTITDVVGSLNGTAGSGISSTIGALCDQARLGDGTANSLISLPSGPIASLTSAWSIAGYVKPSSMTASGGGNATIWNLDDGTTQIRLVIDHTATSGALCATKNGPTSLFATAAAVFSLNTYDHFIVTYNGAGTYTVYHRGLPVSLGGTAQVSAPSTGNCIMAQNSSGLNAVQGAGEQFVTFTKALTAAEALQLHNSYEQN
jgi:hypothetical protein